MDENELASPSLGAKNVGQEATIATGAQPAAQAEQKVEEKTIAVAVPEKAALGNNVKMPKARTSWNRSEKDLLLIMLAIALIVCAVIIMQPRGKNSAAARDVRLQ